MEFGFHPKIDISKSNRHGKKMSIRLSQADSFEFMRMVEPTVIEIPCMIYKIKYPNYRLPKLAPNRVLHHYDGKLKLDIPCII